MKKNLYIFVAVLLFNSFLSDLAVSQWSKMTNSPTTNTLKGVFSFGDSKTVVSVGNSGTVVRTTDLGNTWTKVQPTSYNLRSVYFSATVGFAVGEYGIILKSTDKGLTWTSKFAGTDNFNSIYMYNDYVAWVVGDRGICYRTIDGGNNWTKVLSYGKPSKVGFRSVRFYTSSTGYIAGDYGTIMKSVDGGLNWSYKTSGSMKGGTQDNFYSIRFLGSLSSICATGEDGRVMKSTNSGANWNFIGNLSEEVNLYSMDIYSSTKMWAVGTEGGIYYTSDGGLNWSSQNISSFSNTLYGVDISYPYHWAVGSGGVIVRYSTPSSKFASDENEFVSQYSLSQNFPKPFNPSTTIKFYLKEKGLANITVYDLSGKIILSEKINSNSGENIFEFNGNDLPSGTYFYRLEAGTFSETKKMLLIK